MKSLVTASAVAFTCFQRPSGPYLERQQLCLVHRCCYRYQSPSCGGERNDHSVVLLLMGSPTTMAPIMPPFRSPRRLPSGAVGSTQSQSFYGLIDGWPFTIALTAAEIQSIYNVGAGGKCAVAYPPVLLCRPEPERLVAWHNQFAGFSRGNCAFIYQWNTGRHQPPPGATDQVLTLANVKSTRAAAMA